MARLTGEKKVWRDMPDDPDKGRVEIKFLKPGEERDLQDQIDLYQTMLKPDAEGNMQREVKINPAKGDGRYVFLCAAVTNWENFFDEDGKPMACDDANKIRMARDDPQFGETIGKFRTELAELVATEREAARKNLKA